MLLCLLNQGLPKMLVAGAKFRKKNTFALKTTANVNSSVLEKFLLKNLVKTKKDLYQQKFGLGVIFTWLHRSAKTAFGSKRSYSPDASSVFSSLTFLVKIFVVNSKYDFIRLIKCLN